MVKDIEIRKGNMLLFDNNEIQVTGISYNTVFWYSKIGKPCHSLLIGGLFKGIKITPEFFENNGYKRCETQKRFGNGCDYQPKDVFTEWFDFKINDNVTYRFSNWHYSSGVDNQDCLIWHDNEIRGCEFVHDFQNLFFALEGSDFVFSNNA